ncbi:MAG: sulfotransferase domain-containing protein [Alphaproteobacteria bacterium]
MGGLVWIASYPKSGNTWTRNFLHNLLRPGEDTQNINKMHQLTTYEIAGHWYDGLVGKPIEECSTEDIAKVRMQAQQRIANDTDGLVFVKTHNALVRDHGVSLINTAITAGAIYVVRNPLDVAISYSHHLNATIDVTIERMNQPGVHTNNHKNVVYEVVGSWTQNVHSWTRREHQALHIMRYEDMLADPEKTFGKLCEFLLLQPKRAELLGAIEKSSFNRLKEQEDKEGFHEKPKDAKRFFREGRAGVWKEHLSEEQVRNIVAANREQMKRFGYVPEGF